MRKVSMQFLRFFFHSPRFLGRCSLLQFLIILYTPLSGEFVCRYCCFLHKSGEMNKVFYEFNHRFIFLLFLLTFSFKTHSWGHPWVAFLYQYFFGWKNVIIRHLAPPIYIFLKNIILIRHFCFKILLIPSIYGNYCDNIQLLLSKSGNGNSGLKLLAISLAFAASL
jgi:hypothetical protein